CRPERRHHAPNDREHDRAEREVDEEHPVPADSVGDDATDRGTDTELSPKIAPTRPWYLPRSLASNMSPMTARATGNSAPAPRPWIPRNATNCHISCERPESNDPIRNTEPAKRRMGRRPKRPDSCP